MVELYQHDDYFQLDDEQRDFLQRLLFFEYIEELEVMDFKLGRRTCLAQLLRADMQYHIENESYETAQLYMDIARRFKKEIINFDNQRIRKQ